MGNYLAVAAVSAVLQSLIRERVARLEHVGGSVDVKAGRPIDLKASGVDPNSPALRIYLYQTTPNPSLRNQDLPMRSENGRAVQLPRVALDLHYLIAFYGEEQKWVPQQLLGEVLSLLHTQPVLTAKVIEDVLLDRRTTDPAFVEDDFLARSALSQQLESVRLTQTTLNLEELSKLWSILFQVPYALSVTFQVSPVFIEEDVSLPEALPVRERQIKALPFRQPQIALVTPAMLQSGATLTLRGQQLMADHATVEFGTRSVNIQLEYGNAGELSIALPLDLRAGTNSVRIQHYNNWGSSESPDWRPGADSNLAAFVLQPAIKLEQASVKSGDTLTVSVTPPVGKQQAVFLLLNEAKDAPDARMIRLPAEKIDDPETDMLEFDLTAVAKGEYFVRLVVDGAQSALLRDEQSGRFSEPRVIIA
jgi:uncharacterized protein DUF4255